MTTKQEIQAQTEYADNLFEEMNKRIENLKQKLTKLSSIVDGINEKIQNVPHEL